VGPPPPVRDPSMRDVAQLLSQLSLQPVGGMCDASTADVRAVLSATLQGARGARRYAAP